MKTKKLILAITALAALFFVTACDSGSNTKSSSSGEATTSSTDREEYLNSLEFPQLESDIKADEDVIEMDTTMGKVKMKLFPKLAPKAVENFMTHAKEGYYNGLTFHRVINDFMIQGGDPSGDGTGGESIWGEGFGPEPSDQLYHIRGAVAMAQSSEPNSIGSQFYIVQNKDDQSSGMAKQFTPEKIIDAYKKGGYPSLDGSYTVFGQVIEGMDVVDKIAATPVENDKPKEDVKINKIEIIQEAK